MTIDSPKHFGPKGVLLVNTGSPDAPTPQAVRRYLAEFLNDSHVVDISPWKRWLLLNLIILPFRPKRSARAYQRIWTPEGSPLLMHTRAQQSCLAQKLPEAVITFGMRYGQPSIQSALQALRAQNVSHVTLVPLYPQWADATFGTVQNAFLQHIDDTPYSVTPPFFSEPGFIATCAAQVLRVMRETQARVLILSYHGLPVRQVKRRCTAACAGLNGQDAPCPTLGDDNAHCYRAQCFATSRAIANAIGISHFATCFQSRIKGSAWLAPHTDATLMQLARLRRERVVVACPSFVADCLETLEEIGLRTAQAFCAAGGEELKLVPSVNDDVRFIDALASVIRRKWACMSTAATRGTV